MSGEGRCGRSDRRGRWKGRGCRRRARPTQGKESQSAGGAGDSAEHAASIDTSIEDGVFLLYGLAQVHGEIARECLPNPVALSTRIAPASKQSDPGVVLRAWCR